MTSPSARPSRRRQRSLRVVTAVLLIALAAGLALVAAISGSWLVATLVAVATTALGAAAVRITHRELLDSRREAARDRAEQAQDYRRISEERTAEQALYVADTSGRIARHEAVISRLEGRLADAAAELAEAHQLLAQEKRHADVMTRERDRAAARIDEAEERAATAIVRVAELEQELDVVLAEWRAGRVAPQRKHA